MAGGGLAQEEGMEMVGGHARGGVLTLCVCVCVRGREGGREGGTFFRQ